MYPEQWEQDPWSDMVDFSRINLFHHDLVEPISDFEIIKDPETHLFDAHLDLTHAGIQAIIQVRILILVVVDL